MGELLTLLLAWPSQFSLPCRTIPSLSIMFPLLFFLRCFQKCMWAVPSPLTSVRGVGVGGQQTGITFCPNQFTWMLVPSQPSWEVGKGQGMKEKPEKSVAARLALKALRKTARGKWAGVGCGFCVCPWSRGDAQLAVSLPCLLGVLPVPRAVLRHWACKARGRGGLEGRATKELVGRWMALPAVDFLAAPDVDTARDSSQHSSFCQELFQVLSFHC